MGRPFSVRLYGQPFSLLKTMSKWVKAPLARGDILDGDTVDDTFYGVGTDAWMSKEKKIRGMGVEANHCHSLFPSLPSQPLFLETRCTLWIRIWVKTRGPWLTPKMNRIGFGASGSSSHCHVQWGEDRPGPGKEHWAEHSTTCSRTLFGPRLTASDWFDLQPEH